MSPGFKALFYHYYHIPFQVTNLHARYHQARPSFSAWDHLLWATGLESSLQTLIIVPGQSEVSTTEDHVGVMLLQRCVLTQTLSLSILVVYSFMTESNLLFTAATLTLIQMTSRCLQSQVWNKCQIIESSSNHDDDGEKNVTNFHMSVSKREFCTVCTCLYFIFLHFTDVFVLSRTLNDLLYSCLDHVNTFSSFCFNLQTRRTNLIPRV